MNRRGFIKDLGALLGTSALVKPAPTVIEATTYTVYQGNTAPFEPEMWAELGKRIPLETYFAMDTASDGASAEVEYRKLPDGRIAVVDIRTWRHDLEAVPIRSETPNPVDN